MAAKEQRAKKSILQSKIPYSAPRLVIYGTLHQLTQAKPGRAAEGHGATPRVPPCWIAEVLYGVDDVRTQFLRSWLVHVYAATLTGTMVIRLYTACGRQVARMAGRSSFLRRVLRPLFDAALSRALRDYRLLAEPAP
jgi:hypothetical protein